MKISLKDIRGVSSLEGKVVLLRLDLNVPINEGNIVDDFRIKASMPTIKYLQERKAKILILSHIGDKGVESLSPVADYLGVKILPLKFDQDLSKDIRSIPDGQLAMLENLRQDSREVSNEYSFAEDLARLGDIYVNDAFSVSHRNHASIVSLPKILPSYAGLLIQSEVDNLSKVFEPEHPFLFILGGAKIETKIALVRKFTDIADRIFIGGALANTVFKKKGYEVGVSLVDDGNINLDFILNDDKFILPSDVTVSGLSGNIVKKADQVSPGDNILDIGPESLGELKRVVDSARFILWNGPMGNFEKGFRNMTEDLAIYVSKTKAKTVVGGGDTIASIQSLSIMDKFTFVSSGGGAMLDFLANGTLPGIQALNDKKED